MIKDLDNFDGLNITINTTEDCNLRCKYCYEINKKPRSIKFEDCVKFIDLIFDTENPANLPDDQLWIYDGLIVDFIGGDSLMDVKLLDKILRYVTYKFNVSDKFRKRGWRASISTNGTLFEKPEVRAFCEKWHEVLSLGVSIDGCPEIHDMNRIFPDGRGSMSTIMKWLPWYQNWFPSSAFGTKSTCARNSIPYLYESLKFMHEDLKLKYIHQNFIMEDTGCTEEDYKLLDEQLAKCVDYAIEHRHDLYWSMIDQRYLNGQKPEDNLGDFMNKGHCGSGCMPALSISGDIYPCFRWLPHTQQEGAGKMCTGNIRDGFIYQTNFNAVQEGAKRVNCTKDEKCLNCEIENLCPYCIGGCYALFNEFRRATYICEIIKLQVKWAKEYWRRYDELESTVDGN